MNCFVFPVFDINFNFILLVFFIWHVYILLFFHELFCFVFPLFVIRDKTIFFVTFRGKPAVPCSRHSILILVSFICPQSYISYCWLFRGAFLNLLFSHYRRQCLIIPGQRHPIQGQSFFIISAIYFSLLSFFFRGVYFFFSSFSHFPRRAASNSSRRRPIPFARVNVFSIFTPPHPTITFVMFSPP